MIYIPTTDIGLMQSNNITMNIYNKNNNNNKSSF